VIYGVLLFPFFAAAIAFALRHVRSVAAMFSAAAAVLLAILLESSADIAGTTFFGREIVLSAPMATHMAFTLLLLAIVFVSTWRLPESDLGWMLAFGSVGFMLWGIAIQVTSISVLLIVASTITMLISASGDSLHTSLWNVRALSIAVLAGLVMLSAAWLIEHPTGALTTAPGQLGPILLFMGYWMLLGVLPFGVWLLPGLRSEGSIPRYLLGVLLPHTMTIQLVLQQQTVLAPIGALVSALLLYAGLATVAIGGLGAAVQRSVSGLLAYLGLAEMGVVLMALGAGAAWSPLVLVTCLFLRGTAIVAYSIGAGVLRQSLGDDAFDAVNGAFRRAPMAVMTILAAGLSLAGLPPTAGFAIRFSLYRMVALERLPWAMAMAASGALSALALVRFSARVFQMVPVPGSRREPIWPTAVAFGLGIALIALGFWPQGLSPLLSPWADMLMRLSLPQ